MTLYHLRQTRCRRCEAEVQQLCWPWTGYVMSNGYGKWKGSTAHRVALALTLGRSIAVDKQAAHHCDNPPCCNPTHLYEATRLENMRDAVDRDRVRRGESNPASRLTAPQVHRIRSLRGLVTQRRIAVMFGVSQQTVAGIHLRQKWARLP
jgi:hypothetical protein